MIRAPSFWEQADHPAVMLLQPAAWVWEQTTRWRMALGARQKTPIPSLCIGNVTAGGAGKTPTALAIARLLQERGAKPAFGNRGYGATLPAACLRVDIEKHSAADVGDEALLLAAQAPCYVSADRMAAAKEAADDGATHIIYDDGLQNPAIAYDHALLVLDGAYGLGNGRIMPAGPLREPLQEALRRVDGVILIGDDAQNLATQLGDKPVFRALLRPEAEGLNVEEKYFAFAGIGRPEKFYATCRGLGLQLAATRSFPDHHRFTAQELVGLAQKALEQQAQLLTTTKDAARLSPAWRERVQVLPVTLHFEAPQQLTQLLVE